MTPCSASSSAGTNSSLDRPSEQRSRIEAIACACFTVCSNSQAVPAIVRYTRPAEQHRPAGYRSLPPAQGVNSVASRLYSASVDKRRLHRRRIGNALCGTGEEATDVKNNETSTTFYVATPAIVVFLGEP